MLTHVMYYYHGCALKAQNISFAYFSTLCIRESYGGIRLGLDANEY
jgi:hypothetical protein